MTSLVRFPSVARGVRTWRSGKVRNTLSQNGDHWTHLARGQDSWKRDRILVFGDVSEIFRVGSVSTAQERLYSVNCIHTPCTVSLFCGLKTCMYRHFMNRVGPGFVLHTQRRNDDLER